MRKSTLCYIARDNRVLMLLRDAKEHDPNEGKWIGVGGGLEAGETPDQCVLREVREETGLTLTGFQQRGIVHFRSDQWEDEEMYLYTSDMFEGELIPCDEGTLRWIDAADIPRLNLWEGDHIFLRLLANGAPYFDLSLIYRGNALARVILNGEEQPAAPR